MRVRRSGSGSSLDGSDTRLLIEERLPHLVSPRIRRRHRSKYANIVIVLLLLLICISFWALTSSLSDLGRFGDGSYNSLPLSEMQKRVDGTSIYKIGIVTDLDHDSKKNDGEWISYLKTGELSISPDQNDVSITWSSEYSDLILKNNIAAGGRAMELSDLVVFDHRLLTIDDRTGLIYEIVNKSVVPWLFLNDGPGKEVKPLKGEWMTVKNEELYVGGLGKEWSTPSGEYINDHPMWIKVIDRFGRIRHINWHENYVKIREAVGIKTPGYMIHESVQWSQAHQQWFFLPRRASKSAYDDEADEQRGTNMLIMASSDFDQISFTRIGKGIYEGTKGFSAFQFIPNTNDELIIALKSEEINGKPSASYITVFDISGRILFPDQTIPGKYKFEGLAII